MFPMVLHKLIGGQDLSREEAMKAMEWVMDGKATPAQIASFATSLRMKGETVEEITGFALTMRNKAVSLNTNSACLVDTCGTGGDGGVTFNISTASAIVAAAGGIRVAKHGNRAVSGRSGSADVLEALGISISLGVEQAHHCLERTNLCFMFAPLYHQAMKHAAGVRKEIGFRSVFNLLGPLTNPAGADRQLLGVFDPGVAEKTANVLKELGIKRALVVAGLDGLDELSVSAPSLVVEVSGGMIRSYQFTPEEAGLERSPLTAVSGGDAQYNAEVIRSVMSGERGAPRDIVCLNAGAVFYLAEKADSLQEGVQKAQEVIDTGQGAEKLAELVRVTRGLGHAS